MQVFGYCRLATAQAVWMSGKQRIESTCPLTRCQPCAWRAWRWLAGYRRLLLGHATNVGVRMRSELGVRIILVDALHERAAAFYRLHGFRETADNARTLYLPLGKG